MVQIRMTREQSGMFGGGRSGVVYLQSCSLEAGALLAGEREKEPEQKQKGISGGGKGEG